MSPDIWAEDTPPHNHSLTWKTHMSSPPNTLDGPLLPAARSQHPIHGRRSSYRNNESILYTYSSDITGHPRLGAAVVHIPTSTTIYIDAAGTEETRTIMRAELVAIHTVLTIFSTHDWISIFTNSLSSLQAIRHHHTNPGTTTAMHYHHHMLLLDNITDLLETRRRSGLSTTLHKIRAHSHQYPGQ